MKRCYAAWFLSDSTLSLCYFKDLFIFKHTVVALPVIFLGIFAKIREQQTGNQWVDSQKRALVKGQVGNRGTLVRRMLPILHSTGALGFLSHIAVPFTSEFQRLMHYSCVLNLSILC